MVATIKPDVPAIDGGTPVRTKPWPEWPVVDERDERALLEVLRSGTWGSHQGSKVFAFAGAFAQYHDAAYGICLTNGTAGLEVALRAAGVEPLDEVIVPPYTFVASATAILAIGAIPVFADIKDDTFLIDPEDVARKITPRTKAILPVHLGGRPADMDALRGLARAHGLKVIEDCAQAHGAAWRGQRVGAIGDAGAFSFQSSKNLTAGEGGIVLTNDRELYRRAYSLVNVGRIPKGEWQPAGAAPASGEWRRNRDAGAVPAGWYQHEAMGWNLRMTEFQGALLLAQLERFPAQLERRAASVRYLDRELAKIEGILPHAPDARVTTHGYHLYYFRYDQTAWGGRPREWFLRALTAEGIPVGAGYTTPLYRMPAVISERRKWATFAARMGVTVTCPDSPEQEALPVAERICAGRGARFSQNILLGDDSDMADIVTAIARLRRAV